MTIPPPQDIIINQNQSDTIVNFSLSQEQLQTNNRSQSGPDQGGYQTRGHSQARQRDTMGPQATHQKRPQGQLERHGGVSHRQRPAGSTWGYMVAPNMRRPPGATHPSQHHVDTAV